MSSTWTSEAEPRRDKTGEFSPQNVRNQRSVWKISLLAPTGDLTNCAWGRLDYVRETDNRAIFRIVSHRRSDWNGGTDPWIERGSCTKWVWRIRNLSKDKNLWFPTRTFGTNATSGFSWTIDYSVVPVYCVKLVHWRRMRKMRKCISRSPTTGFKRDSLAKNKLPVPTCMIFVLLLSMKWKSLGSKRTLGSIDFHGVD